MANKFFEALQTKKDGTITSAVIKIADELCSGLNEFFNNGIQFLITVQRNQCNIHAQLEDTVLNQISFFAFTILGEDRVELTAHLGPDGIHQHTSFNDVRITDMEERVCDLLHNDTVFNRLLTLLPPPNKEKRPQIENIKNRYCVTLFMKEQNTLWNQVIEVILEFYQGIVEFFGTNFSCSVKWDDTLGQITCSDGGVLFTFARVHLCRITTGDILILLDINLHRKENFMSARLHTIDELEQCLIQTLKEDHVYNAIRGVASNKKKAA